MIVKNTFRLQEIKIKISNALNKVNELQFRSPKLHPRIIRVPVLYICNLIIYHIVCLRDFRPFYVFGIKKIEH